MFTDSININLPPHTICKLIVTFGDMEDILLQARMSLVRSTVSHQFSELSLSMLTCDWSIVRILIPDWSQVTDTHPGHHLLTFLLVKLHQTPHLTIIAKIIKR